MQRVITFFRFIFEFLTASKYGLAVREITNPDLKSSYAFILLEQISQIKRHFEVFAMLISVVEF